MKKCCTCKKEKELPDFGKNKSMKDGLNPACKDCNRAYHKKYSKTPEQRKKNRERQKEWWNSNRERGNKRQKKYRKNNDLFKISNALRSRVKYALIGCVKSEKTFGLLGCSPKEWKKHLEDQFSPEMNWNNYGTYWEVDHIVPVGMFDLTDLNQQKKAFHYTNTQPLEWKKNRQKGCRWVE